MTNLTVFIVAVYITLGFIPKAIWEAVYFKNKEEAKEYLQIWAILEAPLLLVFLLSLILNNIL